MAKKKSPVRELIVQAITNGSNIEADAKNNNSKACFQIGMIHLLGILSPIDFKKAASYFANQSLADDSNANRLLGFIAECEGNYSEAFKHYANASSTTDKGKEESLYKKASDERSNLQKFFKEMDLPTTALNKEITAILNSYAKGGKSKVEACLKIATICNDESSCLEVAQTLYDTKDFYSAQKWLHKGNIANENPLYIALNDKVGISKKALKLPNELQVISIQGSSLLPDNYASNDIVGIKTRCDDASLSAKKLWLKEVPNLITPIKTEEEERIEKQRKKEFQALLQEQEEEERKRRRRNIAIIGCAALFFIILFAAIGGNSQDEPSKVSDSAPVTANASDNAPQEKVHEKNKKEVDDYESTSDQESESEQSVSENETATSIEFNKYFNGYINNKYEIVVALSQNGAKLEGHYYYVQTMRKSGDIPSTYISLTGTIDSNGNANLIGKTVDGTEESWEGQFESDGHGRTTFHGTFHGANGKVFDISMATETSD